MCKEKHYKLQSNNNKWKHCKQTPLNIEIYNKYLKSKQRNTILHQAKTGEHESSKRTITWRKVLLPLLCLPVFSWCKIVLRYFNPNQLMRVVNCVVKYWQKLSVNWKTFLTAISPCLFHPILSKLTLNPISLYSSFSFVFYKHLLSFHFPIGQSF